jgi:hypothetical protein
MSETAKDEIINRMEVPERDSLFVLGCFERRVTFYNQQVRALNLIWALQDRLSPRPKSVAVVGAGAGGLTAALAAAYSGCRVSIFDRLSFPLAFIGRANSRWIHPHIYDWPADGSEEWQAGLPLLNWRENLAAKVVEEVWGEWTRRSQELGIETHNSVTDLSTQPLANGHLLRWNGDPPEHADGAGHENKTWGSRDGRRMRVQAFDIVILAVGFGVEESTPRFPEIDSYWSADKIDEEDRITSRPRRKVLVSGNGDGGLIDALRYSFRDFRHESILRELREEWLTLEDYQRLKQKVLGIEREARLPERKATQLEYLNLEYRRLADSLMIRKDIPLRRNIDVFLTGKQHLPLDLTSAALNRFLFSLTNTQFIPGGLDSVVKSDTEYIATFNDGRKDHFDNVVIRHGPRPAMGKYFAEISCLCEKMRSTAVATSDPARDPHYGSFYKDLLGDTGISKAARALSSPSVEEIESAVAATPPANTVLTAAEERYREALLGDLQKPVGED